MGPGVSMSTGVPELEVKTTRGSIATRDQGMSQISVI